MDKIDVKSDIRYVCAMMSDVPMFIARDVKTGIGMMDKGGIKSGQLLRFALTDNIAVALKSPNKDTAREVIRQYKIDNRISENFTILPIEISYRIIDHEG